MTPVTGSVNERAEILRFWRFVEPCPAKVSDVGRDED